MRAMYLALLLVMLGIPFAEGQMGYRDPAYIPRVDVAIGYIGVRANAPPGGCKCFSTTGAFASLGVPVRPWLGGAAEIAGSRDRNIGPLGQNLTLTTFTAGPRLVFRSSRFRVFAQTMVGMAHASDSYFPSGSTYSTHATSFAYTLGGGIDYHLSRRLDVRPWQLQYLKTGFNNGSDNSQHHLMVTAGIVLKFKGQLWMPE